MIITVSGQIGSGKTIIGKELAKKLNYTYISTGGIFRKMARDYKMSIAEFLNYAEKNLEVDKETDGKQKNIREDCILDSRMGFHFAKPNLKIWFKAPLATRRGRIAKRDNISLEEAEKEINEREEAERERYKRLYSVNIFNLENYDLIVDTEKFNIEQIVSLVCYLIKSVL